MKTFPTVDALHSMDALQRVLGPGNFCSSETQCQILAASGHIGAMLALADASPLFFYRGRWGSYERRFRHEPGNWVSDFDGDEVLRPMAELIERIGPRIRALKRR